MPDQSHQPSGLSFLSPGITRELHIEYFRRTPEHALELPCPLPEPYQMSRKMLETLLRPLESAFLHPRLNHHGIAHGAATAILAAAVDRIVPFPDDPRARLTTVLAAYLHDSRRIGDWEVRQQPHARRGDAFVRQQGQVLLSALTQEERMVAAAAIGRHSLPPRQKRKRPVYRDFLAGLNDTQLRQHLAAMSTAQRVEFILREADVLDLGRGFYTGPVYSRLARSVRRVRSHMPVVRSRAAALNRLIFPQSPWLIPLTDALSWMRWRDPDILEQFRDDPLGSTLEAGQRLGLLRA